MSRVSPQPFPPLSCFPLQSFEDDIPRRILSIPPAPAVLDQRVIDVGAIQQEDNGKDAPVLVLAVRLECDFFSEDQR